jgi:hypothetical protein
MGNKLLTSVDQFDAMLTSMLSLEEAKMCHLTANSPLRETSCLEVQFHPPQHNDLIVLHHPTASLHVRDIFAI